MLINRLEFCLYNITQFCFIKLGRILNSDFIPVKFITTVIKQIYANSNSGCKEAYLKLSIIGEQIKKRSTPCFTRNKSFVSIKKQKSAVNIIFTVEDVQLRLKRQ